MEELLSEGVFVVLQHMRNVEDTHYDLILEGSVLCPTFQFTELYGVNGKRIQDHRSHYLTFEGYISPEKGEVKRFAQGCFKTFDSILCLREGEKEIFYEIIEQELLRRKE